MIWLPTCLHAAVWCGAVRCGAVQCGVARCGTARRGAQRSGAERCRVERSGAERGGTGWDAKGVGGAWKGMVGLGGVGARWDGAKTSDPEKVTRPGGAARALPSPLILFRKWPAIDMVSAGHFCYPVSKSGPPLAWFRRVTFCSPVVWLSRPSLKSSRGGCFPLKGRSMYMRAQQVFVCLP